MSMEAPVLLSLLICFGSLCVTLSSERGASELEGFEQYSRLLSNVAADVGIPASELLCARSQSPAGLGAGLRVSGEGFHRTLKYTVELGELWRQNSPSKGCGAVVIQRLPQDVFVDPFEIERISSASPGLGIDFNVEGAVDLEQPAPACEKSVLVVNIVVANRTVAIDVPIHARYPKPGRQRQAAVWWNIFSGDLVPIKLPPPTLVLLDGCHGKEEVNSGSGKRVVCFKDEGDSFQVPFGDLGHRAVVAWGTIVAVWGSTLLVLVSLHRRAPP